MSTLNLHSQGTTHRSMELTPNQAILASLVLGLVIAILTGVLIISRDDYQVFTILFLLLSIFVSLIVTIWIGKLLGSSDTVAALKASLGDIVVDIAGVFGVFSITFCALFFGYDWFQQKWWSSIEPNDPMEVKKMLAQYRYVFAKLDPNLDLQRVPEVLERFSSEERLRNRLIGQYCYFIKDSSFPDGWISDRLSIEPAPNPPFVILSGRTGPINFESGFFSIYPRGAFYDWRSENVADANIQEYSGMAKLDFKAFSNDDAKNVLEMTGRYTSFGDARGVILLIRIQGAEGGDYCAQVAQSRHIKTKT